MDAAPRIRTPDQRIRVFVSSTLRELEAERRAVRDAVERLRLAPVMFELGARPHPPRALYRSYLEQSDVFVGIYWEKYGWVAPGEQISGLEDEYRLSAGKPSLIYIKEPAPHREERLSGLLADVRNDDRASYTAFRTPVELGELVLADLATLLAERFDAAGPRATGVDAAREEATRAGGASRAAGAASSAGPRARIAGIPAPFTELIGREEERAHVAALLARPEVRIVTLTGPGASASRASRSRSRRMPPPRGGRWRSRHSRPCRHRIASRRRSRARSACETPVRGSSPTSSSRRSPIATCCWSSTTWSTSCRRPASLCSS